MFILGCFRNLAIWGKKDQSRLTYQPINCSENFLLPQNLKKKKRKKKEAHVQVCRTRYWYCSHSCPSFIAHRGIGRIESCSMLALTSSRTKYYIKVASDVFFFFFKWEEMEVNFCSAQFCSTWLQDYRDYRITDGKSYSY